MVKIYCPINDTWIISNETLREIKTVSNRISKCSYEFPNINSTLSLGYWDGNLLLQNQKPAFYFNLIISASKTTANICIFIKNTNYKIYFKNISCCSVFYLPSYMLNPAKYPFVKGDFKIEIKGMLQIEKDGYPPIPRMIDPFKDGLWKNKEKDFNIIVIGKEKNEETIQMHKEVLMAQSSVFERMLESEMEESKTNTLKIIDFEFKTVQLAVEFFYGLDLSNIFSHRDIFELYRFADKYLIDNLMDYITTFISHRLTPSNISEISNLSNDSTSAKLQQICNNFITVYEENVTEGTYIVNELLLFRKKFMAFMP